MAIHLVIKTLVKLIELHQLSFHCNSDVFTGTTCYQDQTCTQPEVILRYSRTNLKARCELQRSKSLICIAVMMDKRVWKLSAIWLKSSNRCGSCVDRVSIQSFNRLCRAGGLEPLYHRLWASAIMCNQFNRCAKIAMHWHKLQVQLAQWRVGSVASNWNPANDWRQRWVKLLPQPINQDHNSSVEGQEPSKVQVRSSAKLQKDAGQISCQYKPCWSLTKFKPSSPSEKVTSDKV